MSIDTHWLPVLRCTIPKYSLVRSLHSHSIVLSDRNALNSKCKFFPLATKNRLLDPSEICALDFKEKFRRFRICSVSATIGNDWSILLELFREAGVNSLPKKDRQRWRIADPSVT
ncbi:MAG: hypothetical protein ACREEK_14985 [Bradyrhizobium sp.]